jgi:sialate O-acetylesterase
MMKEYDIKLPYLISDGMVLQRERQVKIWGEAAPVEKLVLTLCNKQYTTITDGAGKWEIQLDNLSAGGPYEMVIECNNKKAVVKNILIGEVWVLGGQSNMEMPFERSLDLFEDEVKAADYPYIRKFAVPEAYDFHGLKEELSGGSWIYVTTESVLDFSAAGYFFAKQIYDKYKIPIGLIHTAVGGTPAEAWIRETSLTEFTRFQNILSLCKDDDYVKKVKESDEECINNWHKNLDDKDEGLQDKTPWYSNVCEDFNWRQMNLPRSFQGTELEELKGAVWFRKEIFIPDGMQLSNAKLVLGTIINGDDTYINGIKIGANDSLFARRRYDIPEGLLKTGKNLLAVRVIITRHLGAFVTDMPYFLKLNGNQIPLTGSWKYRIGAKTEVLAPTTTFQFKPTGVYNGMIYPIRKYTIRGTLWYQGESNTDYTKDYKELFEAVIKDWRAAWDCGEFPFLYVQLASYCPWRKEPAVSRWAEVREAQRRAMDIPNTAMAVTCDVGEYNDIHPRDKKTVGHRLALLAMNIVYGEKLVYSGPIYHHKEIEGDKIRLHFNHAGSGLKVKGDSLKTFAICAADGTFIDAEAKIEGNTVIAYSKEIKEPAGVRYAWSDNPEEANLYNVEGLPASPFTTEFQCSCFEE